MLAPGATLDEAHDQAVALVGIDHDGRDGVLLSSMQASSRPWPQTRSYSAGSLSARRVLLASRNSLDFDYVVIQAVNHVSCRHSRHDHEFMKPSSQITSHDIARAAGVSQATVSRVLRGAENVNAETRAKVIQAARALNYRPNVLARAMRTSRIGVIGVVVARLSNPLYTGILRALSDAVSQKGLRMVLWDTEGSGEIAAIDAIRQSLVDGVIFAAATRNSPVLEEAVAAGLPVVLVNRKVEGVDCSQVSSDNRDGAAKIAQYFHRHRRKRIGFVTGSREPSTIRDREAGFLEALQRLGIPLDGSLVRNVPFSHQDGRAAMRSLLELDNPPDAVFCVNDLLAFGAMDAAHDLGHAVPERCWIVGFDDVEIASWSRLSLTTVRQPIQAMVEDGVRLLLERLDNPEKEPTEIIHPVNLMIRDTTARAPFGG